jgi:hypothetical protein
MNDFNVSRMSRTDLDEKSVLFLLGVFPRSGTNFLKRLVCLHPACRPIYPVYEDHLLAKSHYLLRYVDEVYRKWEPNWGCDSTLKDHLLRELTRGIEAFLVSLDPSGPNGKTKYVVTKTPRVDHLKLLQMFTRSTAMVLVRDGRSLVESGMKSFGWNFQDASLGWARSAKIIVDAKEAGVDFLLVRYEDLVTDLSDKMTEVFSFLNIDVELYDFEAAEKLPIRGSSVDRGGREGLHWEDVPKTAAFNPIERWLNWSPQQHRLFNAVAGRELTQFGYNLF